jgi:hypothetical protein
MRARRRFGRKTIRPTIRREASTSSGDVVQQHAAIEAESCAQYNGAKSAQVINEKKCRARLRA